MGWRYQSVRASPPQLSFSPQLAVPQYGFEGCRSWLMMHHAPEVVWNHLPRGICSDFSLRGTNWEACVPQSGTRNQDPNEVAETEGKGKVTETERKREKGEEERGGREERKQSRHHNRRMSVEMRHKEKIIIKERKIKRKNEDKIKTKTKTKTREPEIFALKERREGGKKNHSLSGEKEKRRESVIWCKAVCRAKIPGDRVG
ncbi:hypothetical protein B0I35DRAFT_14354 [Stachybotrys elegans]|uniref:Uncharacterized protein n=1 Tax=Stachybotrys elegans TaxID=80388 RepID=A0A8K0WXB1_9HYPO|nr:hypothetical protein B0I35DRAFT_14354 [Stachybotrys elegans]